MEKNEQLNGNEPTGNGKRKHKGHRLLSIVLAVMMTICCVFIIIFASPSKEEKAEVPSMPKELNPVVTRLYEVNPPREAYINTYKFKDDHEQVWELTLFEDETAKISSADGKETYEGKWDYDRYRGFPNVWFADSGAPTITFPAGSKKASWLCLCIINNFVYLTRNAMESGDTTKRLVLEGEKYVIPEGYVEPEVSPDEALD